MEILLVEGDRLVRDQVKVGLQQFPEFSVTTGEGYAAVNEARQREFDCVFLGVDPDGQDGLRLLEHIRSFDADVDVVAFRCSNASSFCCIQAKIEIDYRVWSEELIFQIQVFN